MKIVSGRIRFKGLLTKVQAIKYNAKHVSRGAFATAEELALQTNVNESMKRIDELQRKLLSWSEAQNYMQMGKHYVRQEAGGDELSELADIATKRMDTVAGELKKEANKLSQLIIDHLSKKEAWGCVDAVRRSQRLGIQQEKVILLCYRWGDGRQPDSSAHRGNRSRGYRSDR